MYSTLQKRKIHVGSELDLKYDVCLIMPLYYHTEIEAKSEKELWEQIDELKHDYQKLSEGVDVSKSDWTMSYGNDIEAIRITDAKGRYIL